MGPMNRSRGSQDVVGRAIRGFVLGSVVALLALILAIVLVGQRLAREQALDDARERAGRLADVVGQLVTDELYAGRAGAGEPISAVLESRFDEGYLWRAKVWAPDGTVLWSDRDELVGQRFDLEPADQALLGTRDVHAELTTLEEPENAQERNAGETLEVYVGSFDAGGDPLLFEAYISTKHMNTTEKAFIRGFAPVAIGGLLLFQLAVLPLAVSLARRVRRSEAERVRMSVEASELERKRIAQELHDGVVQDLAGVGFALPGVRRALEEGGAGAQALDTVDHIQTVVQRDVGALRSMMIEVYPPDLLRTGILDAVEDLADAGRAMGLRIDVRGDAELVLPLDIGRLVYRVVREGLHNVLKHAGAEEASVVVRREGDAVRVLVLDDGRGLTAGGSRESDSLGLRLLNEAVEEASGRITLCDAEGDRRLAARSGACLEAVIPVPADGRRGAGLFQGSSKRRPGELQSQQ
jgi:two-component system NarL family sensor kinase